MADIWRTSVDFAPNRSIPGAIWRASATVRSNLPPNWSTRLGGPHVDPHPESSWGERAGTLIEQRAPPTLSAVVEPKRREPVKPSPVRPVTGTSTSGATARRGGADIGGQRPAVWRGIRPMSGLRVGPDILLQSGCVATRDEGGSPLQPTSCAAKLSRKSDWRSPSCNRASMHMKYVAWDNSAISTSTEGSYTMALSPRLSESRPNLPPHTARPPGAPSTPPRAPGARACLALSCFTIRPSIETVKISRAGERAHAPRGRMGQPVLVHKLLAWGVSAHDRWATRR